MPQDLTDDKSTLVQVLAWCRQATSHYLNQCWPRSPMPYGITRPQWVKWPEDVIWRQRSGSILALVMACCLTAPSHYLNQCPRLISKLLWHSPESDLKLLPHLPGANAWWHHQMETFSALMTLCEGNPPGHQIKENIKAERHWSLWGESTSHRWIPLKKTSDSQLWCFLWSASVQKVEQLRHQWFETPSRSL